MLSLPPTDADVFFDALKQWDRPEEQLRARCLEPDVDTDAFVDGAFASGRVVVE